MVASRSGSWLARRALGAVVLAMGVALACASSPPEPASQASQESAAADRLTDVQVESGDGGSIVTLLGLVDPVYTAFLHTEPRALVLDLAAVEIATPNDLVMVYDGLVENVTVSTYGGSAGESLTRVEIALSQDATYEIASTPSGLQAVISRGDGSDADLADTEVSGEDGWVSELGSSEAAPEEDDAYASDETGADSMDAPVDPWSDPAAEEIEVADGEEALEMAEMPAPEPAAPATSLTGIQHTQTDGGVLVHLVADGAIGAMETFTLTDPDRLVIDMPGLTSQVTKNEAIGSALVTQVRVGAHPDKVRVVIDGGEGPGGFEERRMTPVSDGLYLALGAGPELDAALAEALNTGSDTMMADLEEPTLDEPDMEFGSDELAMDETVSDDGLDLGGMDDSEPTPVEAGARVYGIHYDSEEDYERVVILSDVLVDYDVLTPDSETVVISIPNASVADEATGRVTAQPKRPISLISTFQQPDVDTPEVRVVVKRAAGLEPSVTRRGSMLFVDFPNTGLVASPPPAFATEEEWVAAGLAGESTSTEVAGDMELQDLSENAAQADSMDMEIAMDGSAAVIDMDDTPAALDSSSGLEFDSGISMDGAPGMLDAPSLGVSSPAALEPPAAAEILQEGGLIDGKEYEGRRISLDFKDVPVADVLRLIAEVSDLNLIAGDEVEGNVTIRLVDVPWDQALDVILLTKGLGFVRVGNVLRIAPADIIKAEEELRLQERRNKETLEDLVVKLQPVNYANVADMAKLVKRLLTPRGTVNVDVRTNTLILKDIPSVIDEATALIKAIDTETPQVLIEAKIVEAALDFSRELGSVWSVGTNEFEDGFTNTGVRRNSGTPEFRLHDDNNVIFGNPITSVPTALANMSAFVLNEQFNIDVQVQAAEATGDGKVISSPRVLTLDNREAEIQQGVSIPFQTFENGDAKLEFIDAVLSLLVTPHVTSDKTIIMQVEVTRNAPDDSVPTPTGSPAIARAEARTETLVKDGQTLVIGGIYTVNESERESRVPYLHRIPVIGSAFKSRELTDQRKELLIFVTPRIVLASELAGGN